jgi:hypothetical protein
VFGAPVYSVDNDPPEQPSLVSSPEGDDATDWVTTPASDIPTPVASTKGGGNGRWYTWNGQTPLKLQNPDGEDIRQVYFPRTPIYDVAISSGLGSGNTMYTVLGGNANETIPIPSGNKTLVLTAITPPIFGSFKFVRSVQIYISSDPAPGSTGIPQVYDSDFFQVGPVSNLQITFPARYAGFYLYNSSQQGEAALQVYGPNLYSASGGQSSEYNPITLIYFTPLSSNMAGFFALPTIYVDPLSGNQLPITSQELFVFNAVYGGTPYYNGFIMLTTQAQGQNVLNPTSTY